MEILTVSETAATLGVKKFNLNEWIRQGKVIAPRKTISGKGYYVIPDLIRLKTQIEELYSKK